MRLTLLCSLPFIYAVWSYNTLTVGRNNVWIKNRVLIADKVIDKCCRLLAFCWGRGKDNHINRITTAGVRNQSESITSRIPNMWLFHNGQLKATDAWDVTTGNLEDIYWRSGKQDTYKARWYIRSLRPYQFQVSSSVSFMPYAFNQISCV